MVVTVSDQKLWGGYYTPEPIARFLAAWALDNPAATVLEPSAGDGNLSTAAAERLLALGAVPREIGARLTGVELYEDEAATPGSSPPPPSTVEPGKLLAVAAEYGMEFPPRM